MKTIRILLFIGCLLTVYQSSAQSYRLKLRKADKLYNYGRVNGSILKYENILKEDSLNSRANFELGRIYLINKEDYPAAINYLEKSIKNFQPKDTIFSAYSNLADAYKLEGDYANAVKNYEFFLKNGVEDNKAGIIIRDQVSNKIQECNFSDSILHEKTFTVVRVVNLGQEVNSELSEYCSVYFPNTKQLMYTARYQDNKKERKFLDLQYFESGYTMDSHQEEDSIKPEQININTKDLDRTHFSVVSRTLSGDTVVFYRDNKLWLSKNENGLLSEPVLLSEQINRDYYQPHGAFGPNNDYFIFSSSDKTINLDLFIVKLLDDGTWSDPELMNFGINTSAKEDSPFITSDGKTLYFSSDRNGGFGNYDVYKSNLVDGEWSTPVNMGVPINSAGHDIFFTLNINDETGFLSSNRGGGEGSMDIYMFTNKPYPSFDCGSFAYAKPEESRLKIITSNQAVVNEFVNFNSGTTKLNNIQLSNTFWRVDGEVLKADNTYLNYVFDTVGIHVVDAQVFAYDKSERKYFMDCISTEVDVIEKDILFLDIDGRDAIKENLDYTAKPDLLNASPSDETTYEWFVDDVYAGNSDSIFNYNFSEVGDYDIKLKSTSINKTTNKVMTLESTKSVFVYGEEEEFVESYAPELRLLENYDPVTGEISTLQAKMYNVPNDKIIFYDWYINNNYVQGLNSDLLAYNFRPLDVIKVVGNGMTAENEIEFTLDAYKTFPNVEGENQIASVKHTLNLKLNEYDAIGDVKSVKAEVQNLVADQPIEYKWYVNGEFQENNNSNLLVREFTPLDKVRVVSIINSNNPAEKNVLESTIIIPDSSDPVIVVVDNKPVVENGELNPVYFPFDKYYLTKESKLIMDNNVNYLKSNKTVKIFIEGNTDSIGDSNYNVKLSEKRAKSVYNYLIANGITDAQIVGFDGNGEAKPKAKNTKSNGRDNPVGRKLNRRVDFNTSMD